MCRDSRLIAAPEFDHPNPVCVRTGCVLKEDGKPECAQGACAAYKPTPTPSITVGTQVRLTGVVTYGESSLRDTVRVDVKGDTAVWVAPSLCEVIRQPFKRGEVVYNRDESEPEPFVVLNDESLGMVDVVCCRTGFHIANDNPEAYERRP